MKTKERQKNKKEINEVASKIDNGEVKYQGEQATKSQAITEKKNNKK
ncbi:hypothetical protein [Bacillus sp. UNC438CL73TsuS30]|nr:hypothetical protein [Bacillus sp. UNC438CL73TsuS30]